MKVLDYSNIQEMKVWRLYFDETRHFIDFIDNALWTSKTDRNVINMR